MRTFAPCAILGQWGLSRWETTPRLGEECGLRVQCDGDRTMGYRDANGVWRNLGNDMELKGLIEVLFPYKPWDLDF